MKKYKCMVMVTAMMGLVRAVWCDDGDRVFGVRKRKKRRRGRGGRGVGRGNRGRRKRRRRREVEEQEYEEEARQPGRRMTRTDKKTETRCHSRLWYV